MRKELFEEKEYFKIECYEELDGLLNTEDVWFYGAGTICKKIIETRKNCKKPVCSGILQSNTSDNKELFGIKIYQHKKSQDKDKVVLVTTTVYSCEIAKQLAKDGIDHVYILSEDFENILDERISSLEFEKKIETVVKKIKKPSQNNNLEIMFISPPYWDMYAPFSAVPCLVADLRNRGHKVSQIDLGILCTHHAINKFGRDVYCEISSKAFYWEVVSVYEKNPYKTYDEYKKSLSFLNNGNVDVSKLKEIYFQLNYTQQCLIHEFYERIYYCDVTDIDFDKCESITEMVKKIDFSILLETLLDDRVSHKMSELPDVVGISMTSTCQFLPGCVLAHVIRLLKPETKIVFGGSCADIFVKSDYQQKEDIYQFFDYVFWGEGETAIANLLQFLKGEVKLEDIPNLVVFKDSQTIIHQDVLIEDVQKLAVPDYSDLDLSLYLAPKIVLPYQTSRGCHYGMCAFCNHDEKYRHNYRSKQMKKVVEELVFLAKKYDVEYFQFVDEAIRADCFSAMVEEMDKSQGFKNIKWFYYSRVSRQYKKEILDRAKDNGCEMVMFGVESFNQRLLKFIKKGISAETSKYCLKVFSDAGIKTYAWMMDNLPSETIEEVKEELEEVKRQMPNISAFCLGSFMLVRNTDMYNNPEEYNILSVNDEDARRFESHKNGVLIDKQEMLDFDEKVFRKYQLQKCFVGNRYALLFRSNVLD